MGNRRLFVALEPPEAVRRRLAAIQAELQRAAGRAADEVRWVPAENVHLTLQFLGAVPSERVEAIEAALRAVRQHRDVTARAIERLALELDAAAGVVP